MNRIAIANNCINHRYDVLDGQRLQPGDIIEVEWPNGQHEIVTVVMRDDTGLFDTVYHSANVVINYKGINSRISLCGVPARFLSHEEIKAL